MPLFVNDYVRNTANAERRAPHNKSHRLTMATDESALFSTLIKTQMFRNEIRPKSKNRPVQCVSERPNHKPRTDSSLHYVLMVTTKTFSSASTHF